MNDQKEPNPTRRKLLGLALALAANGLVSCARTSPLADPSSLLDRVGYEDVLLDEIAERSFRFFWETADAATGLVPDRWPTPSFASVAAIGFALTAYPIGVTHGWVTREAAAARVHATLKFLHDAPQGPAARGMTGYKGFFYHFLDMRTGHRFKQVELSTIDTALLVAGALYCGGYFNGPSAVESSIRALSEAIYARIDWRWAQVRPPSIGHGWTPEAGHLPSDYKGYNEAMLVYVLALGSPANPVDANAWDAWTSTYDKAWGTHYGQTYLHYPVLFVHQFTHCWIDFRGLADASLRARGLDYAENSRRATLAQHAYAIANPQGWIGYGRDCWGVTACDGPADVTRIFDGTSRTFRTYAGRGIGTAYDDGTIAPYGVGSSITFAPEIVTPTLAAMWRQHHQHIVGRYGFFSFNRSFTFADEKLTHGRVVPGFGWVANDFLGIEVGPLLAMLANHRGSTVWNTMRVNPHLQRGLTRAGFTGGLLG